MYYPGDEGKLHYILGEVGVGVSIHVKESFISYSKGVYDDSTCPNAVNTNNHAVVGMYIMELFSFFATSMFSFLQHFNQTVVGYGYDTKYEKPYWIVRNHWASSWGEGEIRYVKFAYKKLTTLHVSLHTFCTFWFQVDTLEWFDKLKFLSAHSMLHFANSF